MSWVMRLMAAAIVVAPAVALDQRGSDRGTQEPARMLYIDAVAFDGSGAPVRDLETDDFEAWIAGYRVPVERLIAVNTADEDPGGRSIVLLLDDITLPQIAVPRVRQAARRFVDRILPGDRMAIIGLSGDAMKPTGDSAQLLRRVNSYNVRATGVMRIEDLGAQVLTTIASIARQLSEAPGRRKTLVAIGPAALFDTPIPVPALGRDLHPEWVDAMRALAFSKTALYIIDPGGVGTNPPPVSRGFARETGGHAFVNTNDLEGAVDRILREASSYYLIGVTDPPAHRKAPLREVDVRTLRRGITVRARRGIPGSS